MRPSGYRCCTIAPSAPQPADGGRAAALRRSSVRDTTSPGKARTCASTPRPTSAGSRPRRRSAAAAAWAAAGCGSPSPAAPGRRWHRRSHHRRPVPGPHPVRGRRRGRPARRRRRPSTTRAGIGQRQRPLRQLQDRRGRQRGRRLRPQGGEISLERLLDRDAARAGRTDFEPSADRHLQRGRQHRLRPGDARRSARSTARADQQIYLDTTFFDDVLEGQLGGQGGDFVEPYVLAHEYGHHIQNLLGTMGQVRTQQGPTSPTRCGSSSRPTATPACGRGDATTRQATDHLDQGDIDEALDSAKTVGDDRIQQKSGQRRQPRGLDPRLVRAADELVHGRLRARARSRRATPSRPASSEAVGRQPSSASIWVACRCMRR